MFCRCIFGFELEFWNIDRKDVLLVVAGNFEELTIKDSLHSGVCFTGDKPFSFVYALDDMAQLNLPPHNPFIFPLCSLIFHNTRRVGIVNTFALYEMIISTPRN
jgi:hypothetical protein